MATQKQLDANRANASRSSGPRTPEGKAISRCNALTHRAYAEPGTLLAQERQAYESFKSAIVAELAPVGLLEAQAVEGIAWTYWRLGKNRAAEEILAELAEAHRRDQLLRDRLLRRWWRASRSEPSSSELVASDAEMEERSNLREEIEALEAMTAPANPEIERRHESLAVGEAQLQRKLQNELAMFFALRDRREGR